MPAIQGSTAILKLEDGSVFQGLSFGSPKSTSGEVVFNTGMVGYPESLTDPSYRDQILVLTYPLIGNYGVPSNHFESDRIQISGLVISDLSHNFSHWEAKMSLPHWLKENNIPAVFGIDTRELTKKLREKGTMLGKIIINGEGVDQIDPDKEDLVPKVSCKEPKTYEAGHKKIVLVDCGCKNGIIRSLTERNLTVIRVPWDFDVTKIPYDGLVLSNGPGNPARCVPTIQNIKKAFETKKPILGICLGNQLLALAAGAKTFKMKFGHRSQNQPCTELASQRCFITSQNHGYTIDKNSLPAGWKIWFQNANDETIEGIKHEKFPFMSVQFHPEARPGPTDTAFLFDEFVNHLRGGIYSTA